MTDLEKAQELAIKYCKEIDSHGKEVYNIGCEIACNEIAKWKEQQMIEKACEWLENNMHDYFDGNSEFAVAIDFITCDKFVEKFKKAMEGGEE